MTPITIKLSVAQENFFKDDIEVGGLCGDCQLEGLKLHIDDYEGAQAMLARICARSTPTTRSYLTFLSVFEKLNRAIVAAVSKAKVPA